MVKRYVDDNEDKGWLCPNRKICPTHIIRMLSMCHAPKSDVSVPLGCAS